MVTVEKLQKILEILVSVGKGGECVEAEDDKIYLPKPWKDEEDDLFSDLGYELHELGVFKEEDSLVVFV